ncbi:hypothetical protein ACIGXM_34020 [Kitasatospora sp. NPDC052896]|uniref:hypothetical protein n=1 Tax=Kitasatospora sp. NPDC052896 TaxID=3364061 RepID=UPI0037C55F3E
MSGQAWSALVGGLPALLVPPPADPVDRPVRARDGWYDQDQPWSLAAPHRGWQAVLRGERALTVNRPGGSLWYRGHPHLPSHWRRAAHTQHVLLLVTGPFQRLTDFPRAVEANALKLLLTPLRVQALSAGQLRDDGSCDACGTTP